MCKSREREAPRGVCVIRKHFISAKCCRCCISSQLSAYDFDCYVRDVVVVIFVVVVATWHSNPFRTSSAKRSKLATKLTHDQRDRQRERICVRVCGDTGWCNSCRSKRKSPCATPERISLFAFIHFKFSSREQFSFAALRRMTSNCLIHSPIK